jgi:hypothetical protein
MLLADYIGTSSKQPMSLVVDVRGTPLRFDLASYVRGSPGEEDSARALLARSLMKHYLRTLHGDRMGIGIK